MYRIFLTFGKGLSSISTGNETVSYMNPVHKQREDKLSFTENSIYINIVTRIRTNISPPVTDHFFFAPGSINKISFCIPPKQIIESSFNSLDLE